MRRNVSAGLLGNGGLRLQVFTQDELEAIHQATLEVLKHTGVAVYSGEARERFSQAGCAIDKNLVVKLPPNVVEDAIRSAPAKLVLAGRTPDRDVVLEGRRVHFTNFGEGIKINDLDTGELRGTTKKDLELAARVVDYLDPIDVMEKAMGSQDKPEKVCALHNFEAMLTNTTKHIFGGPDTGDMVGYIMRMAEAISGGPEALRERCQVSFITCPVSPLQLVEESCDIIMASARHGAVINVLSMAMSGASSPISLAGTMVTHNAEVLTGLTLAQLTRKGAPVVYGSSTTAMNMRTATATVGSPELGMISAAVAALARYYLLPSWVAGG
jgi:trimethylamine--corrinoid protein Co-methyltransferase